MSKEPTRDGDDQAPDAAAAARRRLAARKLKTMLDPVAFGILTRLALEPLTSREIADALDLNPVEVRKRLATLSALGQVKKVGTTKRNRRAEFLYLTDAWANVLEPADLADLPQQTHDEAEVALLRYMFREVAEVVAMGGIGSRTDFVATRLPLLLDAREVRVAAINHRRLMEAILEEIEAARARLEDGSGESLTAAAHILLFHHPVDRWPRPPGEAERSRRSSQEKNEDFIFESIDSLESSVMEALVMGPMSATEISETVGISSSKARYEIERLLDGGWVKIAGTRPRRGTVERVFTYDYRKALYRPDPVSPPSRLRASRRGDWTARKIYSEAVTSIRERDRRTTEDTVTAQIPMLVDAEGFAAISSLMEAVLEELIVIAEAQATAPPDRSSARLAISGLFLFEIPRR